MATEEYITNGTAEDGTTTGWTTAGAGVESSATIAYAGTRSFALKTRFGFGPVADSTMTQTFTTVPGVSYTITFAYNGQDADPLDSANNNNFVFSVDYEGTGPLQQFVDPAPIAPNTWQVYTQVLVATQTTLEIQFSTEATEINSELSNPVWYVDAISALGPVTALTYITLPENTDPPHRGLSAEDDMSGTLVPEERLIRLPDGRLIDRDERDQPGRDDWLDVYPIRTEQPRSDP